MKTVVAGSDSDIGSWSDITSLAESEGSVRVSTGGAGGSAHVAFQVFSKEAGFEVDFIHFETIAEAIPAIDRGEADVSVGNAGSVYPYVNDGMIKYVFAISDKQTSLQKVPKMPLAPNQGVPRWELVANLVNTVKPVALPPETSDAIASVWEEVLLNAFSDEDYLAWAQENARPIVSEDRETTRETIESIYSQYNEQQKLLQELLG